MSREKREVTTGRAASVPVFLPLNRGLCAGDMPAMCRDGAGANAYKSLAPITLLEQADMGVGNKRVRPNGKKIVSLREQKGLKQTVLAHEARISERFLRDIERKNKPVPATIITDIATALKVAPEEITGASWGFETLKLTVVRSASMLSFMAEDADQYSWGLLLVDPTAATGEEMRQVLMIIRYLVERFSITDEFDNEDAGRGAERPDDFRLIAEIARLQELLDSLRAGGVGVLAGLYLSLTGAEDKSPGREFPVGANGEQVLNGDNSEQVLSHKSILEIRFVPVHVDELEIAI
jgi:transcriptional regulator with XRE-family HTH domain